MCNIIFIKTALKVKQNTYNSFNLRFTIQYHIISNNNNINCFATDYSPVYLLKYANYMH